jgi:NAD+ kinase
LAQQLTRIGVLAHPRRPATAPIAAQLAEKLQGHAIKTWVRTAWNEEDVDDLIKGTDLVVAIGGDGAMLRAARVCAVESVPVLGINMGRLGFLTEWGRDEWAANLSDLLEGRYWIEERVMIRAEMRRGGRKLVDENALNEITISRGTVSPPILLDTYIDDEWTTTYNADGLIISTPTGSTAYALAVGGPILPPESRNILIVPIAPYLSMNRTIVLPEHSEVEVRLRMREAAEAVLVVDGQFRSGIHEEDCIHIRMSDDKSRFVRMRPRNYFYRSLLDRLEPNMQHIAGIQEEEEEEEEGGNG